MPDQPFSSDQTFTHVPVLAEPLLQALAQNPSDHWQNGLFVDATLGGGGHSQLLLDRIQRCIWWASIRTPRPELQRPSV